MTSLRQRLIDDMNLRNLAPRSVRAGRYPYPTPRPALETTLVLAVAMHWAVITGFWLQKNAAEKKP